MKSPDLQIMEVICLRYFNMWPATNYKELDYSCQMCVFFHPHSGIELCKTFIVYFIIVIKLDKRCVKERLKSCWINRIFRTCTPLVKNFHPVLNNDCSLSIPPSTRLYRIPVRHLTQIDLCFSEHNLWGCKDVLVFRSLNNCFKSINTGTFHSYAHSDSYPEDQFRIVCTLWGHLGLQKIPCEKSLPKNDSQPITIKMLGVSFLQIYKTWASPSLDILEWHTHSQFVIAFSATPLTWFGHCHYGNSGIVMTGESVNRVYFRPTTSTMLFFNFHSTSHTLQIDNPFTISNVTYLLTENFHAMTMDLLPLIPLHNSPSCFNRFVLRQQGVVFTFLTGLGPSLFRHRSACAASSLNRLDNGLDIIQIMSDDGSR